MLLVCRFCILGIVFLRRVGGCSGIAYLVFVYY